VERSLSVSNESQESYIRYEKVTEFQNRFSIPRVRHTAKIKLDMEALQKVANDLAPKSKDDREGTTAVTLKVKEGRSAIYSSFTYDAEKTEKQMVTHGEGDDTWETEEYVKVPVQGIVGEVIREATSEDEVKSTFSTRLLSDHLEKLIRAGFRDATLEYAEDMPLKITATRNDGPYAEFWLAPMIGV